MARAGLFDRIGADKLRAVVDDFYRRIFGDEMIGFLFQGKDRARLADKEYEFTARFLGADLPYTGRSMPEAHARSPILGGHFERRLQILRNTLADHDVDEEVVRAWIDHTISLRAQVTKARGSECDHEVPLPVSPGGPDGVVKLKKR
ncbi:MAG TPA: group 1 truncated hemoglobin [Kofleriaceae bacterium]|jgi:hemoglobin|nr:group 1 truncated hemoglobin [Kofleriaceae bacterium]